MPWTARSGRTYRLCLLDTNAISEILKQPSTYGHGFVSKFGPSSHVPCLTIYNLAELSRDQKLIEEYIEFFSVYAHFMLKSQATLLNEEIARSDSNEEISPLLKSFSVMGPDDSFDLATFIESILADKTLGPKIRNWRQEEQGILDAWLANIPAFEPSQPSPNAADAERYLTKAGPQSLRAQDKHWYQKMVEQGSPPEIDDFPSLKVLLYSMYYRLYDPSWEPKPQEVTDVLIAASVPYVDVYITENFQAEILRKVQGKVRGLAELDIAALRDIRSVDTNSA